MAGTAADLFNSATVYGADALDRGDLGRICVGAKADLVFIDLESIRMSPVRDPVRNLVYGAADQDVDRVIIDGRTVVEDGVVIGLDERMIAYELQRIGDHRLMPFNTFSFIFLRLSPHSSSSIMSLVG